MWSKIYSWGGSCSNRPAQLILMSESWVIHLQNVYAPYTFMIYTWIWLNFKVQKLSQQGRLNQRRCFINFSKNNYSIIEIYFISSFSPGVETFSSLNIQQNHIYGMVWHGCWSPFVVRFRKPFNFIYFLIIIVFNIIWCKQTHLCQIQFSCT